MGTKVARVHRNMQNALGACGLTFVPRILASGSPGLKIFRDIKIFEKFENSGFQDFLISRKTPNFKLVFLYERLGVGNSSFRESEIGQKSGFEKFP